MEIRKEWLGKGREVMVSEKVGKCGRKFER